MTDALDGGGRVAVLRVIPGICVSIAPPAPGRKVAFMAWRCMFPLALAPFHPNRRDRLSFSLKNSMLCSSPFPSVFLLFRSVPSHPVSILNFPSPPPTRLLVSSRPSAFEWNKGSRAASGERSSTQRFESLPTSEQACPSIRPIQPPRKR